MPPLSQPAVEPAETETTSAQPPHDVPEQSASAPEPRETHAPHERETSFWRALMRALSPWPV